MKALIEFWGKNKFKLVLAGFLVLLLYLVYRRSFGWDIKIPNPTFSTISNFDSIECLPLARGGSEVWNNTDRRYTGAYARDNRTQIDNKWETKWIAVRYGKIYLGTITGSHNDNNYINFDEVFDVVDQKNENTLLGSLVNVVNTPRVVEFKSLVFDKKKGILSISLNAYRWAADEDENVGGYNEVYTCKEVPLNTLSGSKGLP